MPVHHLHAPQLNSQSAAQRHASTAEGQTQTARATRLSAKQGEYIETAKLLLAGGIAGAASKTATAPLARLTILYQVRGFNHHGAASMRALSMPEAFRQVIRQEGLLALWKGNGVTIIHRLPYSAVNFWAYERFTELWLRHFPSTSAPSDPLMPSRQDVVRRLVAGGAAGMCACTLAYPLDLVRTRLAAQTTSHYYTGISHALRTIVKDEGIFGLYRGLRATLLQVAPSLAINYCAYETLRSQWLAHETTLQAPTVAMSLACGSVAGLVSSTATFPLDLVRRRMQLEGQAGHQKRYNSYWGAYRSILQREGFVGLYSGIIPEYCKVIPGVAIAFCSYEMCKKMLGVRTNVNKR